MTAPRDEVLCIMASGKVVRSAVTEVSRTGRATQGVRLINLEKRNDEIASVCKVVSESEEDRIGGVEESADEAPNTPTDNA